MTVTKAAKPVQKLGPNQRKWLKALESGKFKQGKMALRSTSDGFCCLGVACELFKNKNVRVVRREENYSYNGSAGAAPPFVSRALALIDTLGTQADYQSSLAELNDSGKQFGTIAKLIRANPANYFKAVR